MSAKRRVVSYIDGFNLYHGLMAAGLRSSRWLDLPALSASMLQSDQDLELTRYYTTRVRGDDDKAARQSAYIDALECRGGIEIEYGHFLSKGAECKACGHTWRLNEEKKTDVNIAVGLLDDAFDDRFDTALLISGDSDLVPPIVSVLTRFPEKRVVVAFPPRRHSSELRRVASAAFQIQEKSIRGSRLPNPVVLDGETTIPSPRGWTPGAR